MVQIDINRKKGRKQYSYFIIPCIILGVAVIADLISRGLYTVKVVVIVAVLVLVVVAAVAVAAIVGGAYT